MDKLKMHSLNKVDANIAAIGKLFPNCLTERMGENGEVETAIDFDMLKQELSSVIVEGNEERYQFTWPDKKKAILAANAPISATLRPCREESVDFDTTQNLYIEGDNLDVLKLLQETYLGKIKMIYIDPPYNTGSDFVYNDDFAEDAEEYLSNSGQYDVEGNRLVQNTESNGRFHTDWLNMMVSRLRLAKNLLSKDGAIAISIGYHEVTNLVKLCEEVFSGWQVFPITLKTSGGKPNGAFNISNEYIVFVASSEFSPIPTEEDMKDYASPYHGMNLATFNQVERPNQAYPIYVEKKSGKIIGVGKSLHQRMKEHTLTGNVGDYVYDYSEAPQGAVAVWPVSNKNEQCVWRLIPERLINDWNNGFIKVVPVKSDRTKNEFAIQFLSGGIIDKIKNGEVKTYRVSKNPEIPTLEIEDFKTAGSGIASIWDDKEYYTAKGNGDIKKLFENKVFSYPKPLELLRYLLKRTVASGETVLDFFSGSATSAHAVMQLNAEDEGQRKFIMVQLPEETEVGSEAHKAGYSTICEIGKERIRRAGRKLIKDNPKLTTDFDCGFRVLKLDSSNMKDVYYNPADVTRDIFDIVTDNIKEDRTPEDLLFQVMLDRGIPLSSKIEESTIAGKKVFNVEDGFMIACFDSNLTEETITAIAKMKPYYFVMRDSSMASDSVAANFDQIFATYSPDTDRKVL